jgi:hypothetical protein
LGGQSIPRKRPETAPQPAIASHPESLKNKELLQTTCFQQVAIVYFAKKNVVKPAGFSYVHCQLHRMVPGRTGFAPRRARRETRKH